MKNAIAGTGIKPKIMIASDEKPDGWHCSIKERCSYILRSRMVKAQPFCTYTYRHHDYGILFSPSLGFEVFIYSWETGFYWNNRDISEVHWLPFGEIHDQVMKFIDSIIKESDNV